MSVVVKCPEKKCSQIGCRHRNPHLRNARCAIPERGNIINGCKSPCVLLERDHEREKTYPLGVLPLFKDI